MIRILETSDEARPSRRCSIGRRGAIVELERRVARIVATVRRGGDRALLAFARKFDGLAAPIDVDAEEMRDAAARPARGCPRGDPARPRAHPARRPPADAAGWTRSPAPGVSIEQRVTPLDRVGCYVPAGRYPAALLAADDRHSRARRRRSGRHRRLPAARRHGDGGGARSRRRPPVAARRRARDRGAGLRHARRSRRSTRSSDPATPTWRRRRRWSRPTARSTSSPGPSEILVVSVNGRPAWIAADLLAQAEHDEHARAIFVTPIGELARRGRRRSRAARCRRTDRRAPALERNGAIVLTRVPRRGGGALASGWRRNTWSATRRRSRAGCAGPARCSSAATARRPRATTSPAPTTCCRRAAPRRGRGGLSAADFVRVSTVQRVTRGGLRRVGAARDRAGRRRRAARRTRRSIDPHDRGTSNWHATASEREHGGLLAGRPGNAAGARPAGRGCYPDYDAARAAVAGVLRRPADHVLLTNGLDEGILAAVAAAFRERTVAASRRPSASRRRSTCTRCAPTRSAAGWSRCRSMRLRARHRRRSWRPSRRDTRIVFVTNPHNPSGVTVRARRPARARARHRAGDAVRGRGLRRFLRRDR